MCVCSYVLNFSEKCLICNINLRAEVIIKIKWILYSSDKS